MFQRSDGIVDFDRSACIGCQACIAACLYHAIYIDPVSNSAEKCNFCSHRVVAGLQPACVAVCPTQAIIVGDLNDPGSKIAKLVAEQDVTVRKPEKQTNPKLYYVNGQPPSLRCIHMPSHRRPGSRPAGRMAPVSTETGSAGRPNRRERRPWLPCSRTTTGTNRHAAP